MPVTNTPAKPGRFVITGPTGWIGRAVVARLLDPNDPDALGTGEGLALFGSRAGWLDCASGEQLAIRPLTEIAAKDVTDAHVIHLAFLTKDKLAQSDDETFIAANRTIDSLVLDACREGLPRSVFVASSGAAKEGETALAPHPYALAKLEQETRFLQFAETSGVPTFCGRIFNIAGHHINKLEAYALADFVVQALAGGPIRIAARTPVFRSFLHVNDLSRIILRSSRRGIGRSSPVDLCGETPLEMLEIAKLVAKAIDDRVLICRPTLVEGDPSEYLGDHAATRQVADELGIILKGSEAQVRDTVAWIRASQRVPNGENGHPVVE